jgi:UDP-4-amino-4-deoxy-L-arabinose formyltransferase/UDP-glucuronic acid dehydrogenase (UDP-4-keto-hexauronic acid decarboxylating)
MVRAVFFGSSDSVFSNRHFAALLGGCEVAAVVDVPPARRVSTNSSRQAGGSFVEIARRKGIPAFEPASPNAQEFIENVKALNPDFFMAVGYMLLLKSGILSVPRVVAANFHASLLPSYRGKHPVFWALRNGEPWCGLSIHEMSPGLDTGDIIFQVRVPAIETDSVSRLYERIMTMSIPMVSRLIEAVAEGAVPRRPQPSEGASYFGATSDADFRISWSMEAALIQRWVTATPGQCFSDLGGRRVFLLDARAFVCANGARAGTILAADPGLCMIAAAGGAIGVQRVRLADGTETSAHEAFTRLGLGEGAVLGGQ